MSRFRLSEPENLLLVMIVIGTIFMVFYGKTIVKIPRCKIYEVYDEETGEEWLLEDLELIENLELPDWDPDYEAPCLPFEDPYYYGDYGDYYYSGLWNSYDYYSYNFGGYYDDYYYYYYDYEDYDFNFDYDILTEEAEQDLVAKLREKLHEEE